MDDAPPDLLIAGFSAWVTGRAYPDAELAWDRDQNVCRAIVQAKGARVELFNVLSSTSLNSFATALDELHATLQGEAALGAPDLDLDLRITPTSLGHMTLRIEASIGLSQRHEFSFECDQTDLLMLARQCRAILARLPAMEA